MPNFPVDVNSWGKSACYPRSTFCPLSDGLSTQHHQIIKTCFRTCPKCLSRSQASLCLYTRALIPNQGEETFAHLRYSLGGDRPSQTARLTVSPDRIHGRRLEIQQSKSGIPPATPQKLTPLLPSLPPILYMNYRIPVLSCSKAPWGLSV